jgi:hypothetical protein
MFSKVIPAYAMRIQVWGAACAIAVAAAVTPAAVANADPLAPISSAALGGAAGSALAPDCPVGESDCEATGSLTGIASTTAFLGPAPNILQNQFWWVGPANPTPPPRSAVFVFTPLPLIPGFLQPLYGWFTQHLNFELCFLGASIKIGPYGTVTGSVGQGCN